MRALKVHHLEGQSLRDPKTQPIPKGSDVSPNDEPFIQKVSASLLRDHSLGRQRLELPAFDRGDGLVTPSGFNGRNRKPRQWPFLLQLDAERGKSVLR